MSDPSLFTYKMRKSTRTIHAVSDALVNAKLALALNSNAVWAEGLLVFYEIFRFLEEAMVKLSNKNLGRFYIKSMLRTDAFEEDLKYFYGDDWKKAYKIRDSVANYLAHLNHLLETDSDLLMAYVYHLYMGLLSGGQILKKKRKLTNKLFHSEEKMQGESVTDFGNTQISELKTELKNVMNSIAETLDDDKKAKLIQEGSKVFELNNMIIRTINSADRVLLFRTVILILTFSMIVLMYLFVF